ncbi:hypothetical protein [Nocardia suismassiliense]|uniref:hypothetical protein n=1 Tax=Nocardia suismassiliense TaxID=2077092 RepID=UPI00131F2F8B|nr:hypothetical protein [Nocardia suismassiliense]
MRNTGPIVVLTDHSSTEGSSALLARAVEWVTDAAPLVLDARHFYDGGEGVLRAADADGAVRAHRGPAERARRL